MQKFFVGIAKKINNIFMVNSNKISIDPYLIKKLCWANQIFVDSTKHFSGCIQKCYSNFELKPFSGIHYKGIARYSKLFKKSQYAYM